MESETCVLLHMGVYLEEYLRLHPAAKCLFTPDLDAKAPARLKSNHRNNLDRHVLNQEEFQELCDALTFTPSMIYGMSTSSVLVDARRPLSSLVKSVVDAV